MGDGLRFSFRTAAGKFHLIDESRQASLVVMYGEGNDLIRSIDRRQPSRELYRQLQRYTINIPRYQHKRLVDHGAIWEAHPGIFVQVIPAMYDLAIGFCADRSDIFAPDDLIIS